jgi:hypothetical protein
MPVTSESAVGQLTGSVAHLIRHIATCEICESAGTRYCTEIGELASLVLADRNVLIEPSHRGSPRAWYDLK